MLAVVAFEGEGILSVLLHFFAGRSLAGRSQECLHLFVEQFPLVSGFKIVPPVFQVRRDVVRGGQGVQLLNIAQRIPPTKQFVVVHFHAQRQREFGVRRGQQFGHARRFPGLVRVHQHIRGGESRGLRQMAAQLWSTACNNWVITSGWLSCGVIRKPQGRRVLV